MKAGWKTKQLDELAQVKGGKRVPKGYNLQTVPTNHPYLTVSDFTDDGTIDTSRLRYISDDIFAAIARYTISSEDLYISIAGTIGKTGFVPRELDGANLTENACKLVLNPGVHRDFLYYFTKTDEFIKQTVSNTRIAAQPKLALERLKTIALPMPPLAEQKRIAAILDEAFSGITTVVANTDRNLANARELFEGYVKSVFAQKGKGWIVKRLGDICTNLDGKRVPITKSDRVSGNIPYYGASGVVDYVSGHLFDEDILLISEDGANLLARTYPIAFSVRGKCWVNNHAHVVSFSRIETQKIVEFYLNSISLAPYVSGMAQPKLNQKSLNSIMIPLPPVAEQARIVERLETLQTDAVRLETIYRQKLETLADLKQSILERAFSGELTAQPARLPEKAFA